MQRDDLVFFSASPDLFSQAASAFEMHSRTILSLQPDAEVHHVGSTAIPGLLTKGDLDILVRVDRNRFADADALLASIFPSASRTRPRNRDLPGSERFGSHLSAMESS